MCFAPAERHYGRTGAVRNPNGRLIVTWSSRWNKCPKPPGMRWAKRPWTPSGCAKPALARSNGVQPPMQKTQAELIIVLSLVVGTAADLTSESSTLWNWVPLHLPQRFTLMKAPGVLWSSGWTSNAHQLRRTAYRLRVLKPTLCGDLFGNAGFHV